MLVERIDPDWKWSRYRKVEMILSDDGLKVSYKVSYASTYRPVSDASTLHRSLAQAYQDHRASGKKIKAVLEDWLSRFGLLTGVVGTFSGNEFMREASQVWWIVQVFNVLRNYEHLDSSIGVDPAAIKGTDAITLRLDIPNPGWMVDMDENSIPYFWAIVKPSPEPTAMIDGTIRDHSDNISERNIEKSKVKWRVTYLELLEILGLTISQKLQGGMKMTFESLDRETMPVVKGSGDYKGYAVKGFPFLNVPRGRYGTRGGKIENPMNYTYKINPVLQPQDLLTYIWILCAEELTEIPSVDFDSCKNFEICRSVIKRSRSRSCKHCREMVHVLQGEDSTDAVGNTVPTLASKDSVNGLTVACDKSPTNRHEVRKPKQEYCSSTCRHRNALKLKN